MTFALMIKKEIHICASVQVVHQTRKDPLCRKLRQGYSNYKIYYHDNN